MPELEDGRTSTFIVPTQTGIKCHLSLWEQRTGTPFQMMSRTLPLNITLKLVLSQFCNIPIFFCCFFCLFSVFYSCAHCKCYLTPYLSNSVCVQDFLYVTLKYCVIIYSLYHLVVSLLLFALYIYRCRTSWHINPGLKGLPAKIKLTLILTPLNSSHPSLLSKLFATKQTNFSRVKFSWLV